jgi:predicted nucleic-acid-binding protein
MPEEEEKRSEWQRRTNRVKATSKFRNTKQSFNPEEMIKKSKLNDEIKKQCLRFLQTLQKNKKTKGEEITKEEVKTLIKITRAIAKNTKGNATEKAFKALDKLLSNPKLTPLIIFTIHRIAKKTKDWETEDAFEVINTFISSKDFTIEW